MNGSQQTSSASAHKPSSDDQYKWATDNCRFCDYQGDHPDDKRPIDSNHGDGAVKHLVLHGDIGPEEAEWISQSRNDLRMIDWSRKTRPKTAAPRISIEADEASVMLTGYNVFNKLPADVVDAIRIDGHWPE